jgi:hypothetical protein
MRARWVVAFAIALLLLIGTIPAEARSTSTWTYPTNTSSQCTPNPQLACFAVPSGSHRATISIADDRSAHVTGYHQVACGVPGSTCMEFTGFCDAVVVDLPREASTLYVGIEDPVFANSDALDGTGCASASAYGTTGTITVVWQ